MIRKLSSQTYCLHPRTVARNFGFWEDGPYREHAANANHEKTMQIFRQRQAPVPLHPKQRRSETW